MPSRININHNSQRIQMKREKNQQSGVSVCRRRDFVHLKEKVVVGEIPKV